MIPRNQSLNHERTEDRLFKLQALMVAAHELRELPETYPERKHAETLGLMALDMIEQVLRAHLMEWVGLGGNTEELTEAEIAEAKGVAHAQ